MVTVNDQDPKFPPQEAPYVKLFASPTANGRKITLYLELLGIDYTLRSTDYLKETKEEWFLKINPFSKVPVLSEADSEGKLFNLAESGAIILYLAKKYDTEFKYSYSPESHLHWQEVEFLFFQASSLQPSQGKFDQAVGSGDKKAIEAAKADALKNYQLVEDQLKATGTGFLVGDHISTADVLAFPHALAFKASSNVDTTGLPLFEKWVDSIAASPALKAVYEKEKVQSSL